MTIEELEPFASTNSQVFLAGEVALAALGEGALPILTAFFTGEARNKFGVPYKTFGNVMRCVFATIRILGPIAKPLEPWLRTELVNGDHMCADALAALRVLENDSVEALAQCINKGSLDISWQAAGNLINCGYESHSAFQKARESLAQTEGRGARSLEQFIDRCISNRK